MTRHILFAVVLSGALLAGGCTEVIELDLNTADPKLVIEGYVDNLPGPYYVKLSETLNFDEPNQWPAVGAAQVYLSGSDGSTDTLVETTPGLYATRHLQGQPGVTYTLAVETGGQRYTAQSTLPQPVPLDTAYTERQSVRGGDALVPVLVFRDPAGQANYYTFVAKRQGWPLPGFFTLDDQLRDGQRITRPLRSDNFDLQPGDTLRLELHSVAPAVYDYFYVLSQAAGLGLNQSPTPSNPASMFEGGALGYFSAQAVSARTVVVR